MKRNRKSRLPCSVPAGEIYSFTKKGDTAIVGWLASQLPKGFSVVRATLRHSDRVANRHSLNVSVERHSDGKRTMMALGEFYDPNYLPAKFPRAVSKESKRKLQWLDRLGYPK